MTLTNVVFIAVITSVALSQLLKVFLNHFKDRKGISLSDLVVTGGMPSTHSAAVSSLFATLLLTEGISSLTVISMVLFVIVITDSMGVRRTAGEEGKVLNKIIKLEKLNLPKMHYSLGHQPIEVLAGTALGFFTSLILTLFF